MQGDSQDGTNDMTDEFERKLRRQMAESERGTWRAEMRSTFAPWFDALIWGFQCSDGWADLIRSLTAEIAEVVGGPASLPDLRVTQVKEKYGTLRFYILAVPASHSDAINRAIRMAEERSGRTCETCGAEGCLRETAGGWWYTACDGHARD
jgi:hypothetical protein